MVKPAASLRVPRDVKALIASLGDDHAAADAHTLMAMMRRISGHQPKLWNDRTIGFDAYHYRYESGREGDCHALGLHPGKGKITIYLMDGTERHAPRLARLGKHTTSRACLYLKRLDDVKLVVLEQIIQRSYDYVKALDGRMHRV